ncbi:hypothetical protein [Dongia sp.]|uniref:hypothetical protein n=1 Tax=Dongia sp. TaxID=1977262 RepID=UPI0035ADBD38
MDIDAVVSFEDEAGIRLYDARAYVAESIGGMATIVEVKQPDAAGFVRVSGHYCAPIIIGTDGGWQQVRSVNLRDSYRIVVRGDRQPSAEKLIGPILPAEQIAELRLEYPNC